MTDLERPVKRRTKAPHNYQGRRLVVMLMPGDVIGFREEKCRKVFTAPIDRVFRAVVGWNVEAEREERKTNRRKRRGTKRRARR